MNRCKCRITFPACQVVIKTYYLDILWNLYAFSVFGIILSVQAPLFYILIIWYTRNMDFTKVKRITRYIICVCFLLYLHNKRTMYLYMILTSTILLF